MKKINASQILEKRAKLEAIKLDKEDTGLKKLIEDTKQKQLQLLKLKEVDEERLKMVVQL
jgi:hypothetical protein